MPEKYSEKRYLEQIFNFLHLASRSDVAYLDPVATGDVKQAIYEGVWEVLGHDRALREAITLHFTAMRPRKVRGPVSASTMESFRAQLDYGSEAAAKERKTRAIDQNNTNRFYQEAFEKFGPTKRDALQKLGELSDRELELVYQQLNIAAFPEKHGESKGERRKRLIEYLAIDITKG